MNKDRNIDIMGIVNLTDDSYFAQSRCAGPGQTIERVAQMIDEGASIIDILFLPTISVPSSYQLH